MLFFSCSWLYLLPQLCCRSRPYRRDTMCCICYWLVTESVSLNHFWMHCIYEVHKVENTNPEAMCVRLSPFVCNKSGLADMCRLWMCTFLFKIKLQKTHLIRLGLDVSMLRPPAQILWAGFTDRRISWLSEGKTGAVKEAGEEGGLGDLTLMSRKFRLSVAWSLLRWGSESLLSLHSETEDSVDWLSRVTRQCC